MTRRAENESDGRPRPNSRGREGRVRRLSRRVRNPAWLARAAGVGLCTSALGFVAAVAAVLATEGYVALVLQPLPLRVALALPYLVVGCTVGTVIGAILAWRRRYWSLAVRVHQTVLAFLGVAFVWKLVELSFVT